MEYYINDIQCLNLKSVELKENSFSFIFSEPIEKKQYNLMNNTEIIFSIGENKITKFIKKIFYEENMIIFYF